MKSSLSTPQITIDESNIYQSGYETSNIGKVGKISLRYQQPKIKQATSWWKKPAAFAAAVVAAGAAAYAYLTGTKSTAKQPTP